MHPAVITSAEKARAIADLGLSSLTVAELSAKSAWFARIPNRGAATISEACKSVRRSKLNLPKGTNCYVD